MSELKPIKAGLRRHRRQLARARRLAARGGVPAAQVRAGEDPLTRSKQVDSRRVRLIPGLTVAAIVAHAGFTLGVGAIASAFAGATEKPEERVVVTINELSPAPVLVSEPLPEPTLEPENLPEVEPIPKPKPASKPKPKHKSKPKPKLAKVPQPALLPEIQPPPTKPAPRRVIGANFGSTVQGGNGPTIAVGNALDGQTASTAINPTKVKAHPGNSTEVPKKPTAPARSRNRVASIIPSKGVKLIKPKRLQRVKPTYPPLLKAQGIEANVVVEVQISNRGKVHAVEIIKGATDRAFDAEAKRAAMRETFQPATRNGVAVAFRLTFTYRYRINT